MSNTLCSVVIPAHNAGRYIRETLSSVLTQTYENWECIVVDDFSSDDTADIVLEFAAKDPRFRLIKNEKNLKVAATRNAGVAAAKGEYIAFLDSDDVFVPKKLKKCLKLALKSGCDMVCSSYELIDENSKPLNILSRCSGRITKERLIRSNEIGCSTVFIRRETALKHPFEDRFFHEDYACWLSVIEDSGVILGIDEPLTLYRFMKGTKSNNKFVSVKGVWQIYTKCLNLSFFSAFFRMFGYMGMKIGKYFFKERPYNRRIPVVMDNIIYSLQKVGGISAYWTRLIEGLNADDRYSVSYIESIGALENISRQRVARFMDDPVRAKIPLRVRRFLDPVRNFSEPTICHSSYYRTVKGRHAVKVATMFDFTYEWMYDGFVSKIHIWQQKRAAMNADVILCISENTKKDLLELVPRVKDKDIRVIPLGYNEEVFYYDPSCKRNNQVVFIGSRAAYKNFDAAVDAVMYNGKVTLAVAGSPLSAEETDDLNAKLRQRHFHVEFPSDEDIRHIYNSSRALIYISEYEGFGLPILEAMASGCPVICLNSSAQPEVAGEAGILLDEPDPELISAEIDKLISDEEYFNKKVNEGLERVKDFHWSKCVEKTLNIYRELTGK